MKQNEYEEIMTCIQYGAPALSAKLIAAFNKVVQESNQFNVELQRKATAELEAEKVKKLSENSELNLKQKSNKTNKGE